MSGSNVSRFATSVLFASPRERNLLCISPVGEMNPTRWISPSCCQYDVICAADFVCTVILPAFQLLGNSLQQMDWELQDSIWQYEFFFRIEGESSSCAFAFCSIFLTGILLKVAN